MNEKIVKLITNYKATLVRFLHRSNRYFINFEFIVSERVQVNPDNSRAMSALTFLLFKLNTLQAKIVKF